MRCSRKRTQETAASVSPEADTVPSLFTSAPSLGRPSFSSILPQTVNGGGRSSFPPEWTSQNPFAHRPDAATPNASVDDGKKRLEARIRILENRNNELAADYAAAVESRKAFELSNAELRQQVNRLLAHPHVLDNMNKLEDIDDLATELMSSLRQVEARRDVLLQKRRDQEEDKRLCVVCLSVDKTVVLVPCLHLCVCTDCSNANALKLCPICRKPIDGKVNVFV